MKASSPAGKIRLVLADVDGTLVTKDKILTERAGRAVAALKKRDILFAITSGRPPLGMKMLIEPLKLETPIAGFNGGVFTRPDLSVLSSRTLASDVAAEALELIGKNGLDAWLYTPTDWYIPKEKGPHVERETWTVKFDAKVEPNLGKYADQAVKIVGVTDDTAAMEKCAAECQKILGARASAQKSQPYYLDITHPQANKGAVAEYLAEHYQIKLDEIAVLGDMPNDVPMFKKAGVSIAMGQASPEVQKAATFVTASYEEEGFAKALEQHFLR